MGDILNFDEFVVQESDFLKKVNGIYITENQVKVLEKYGIDIKQYQNVNELIYCIESILNNGDSMDDLEWVSENLSEYNYYANTNK